MDKIAKILTDILGFEMTIIEDEDVEYVSKLNMNDDLSIFVPVGRYSEFSTIITIPNNGKELTTNDVSDAIISFYDIETSVSTVEKLHKTYPSYYDPMYEEIKSGKKINYADMMGGLIFVEKFTVSSDGKSLILSLGS